MVYISTLLVHVTIGKSDAFYFGAFGKQINDV